MHMFLMLVVTLLTALQLPAETVQFHRSVLSPTTDKITASVHLSPEEAIREDSVSFTINHPDVTVTSWESDKTPASFFDKKLKETKKNINNDLHI